jgi:hypothetical protein
MAPAPQPSPWIAEVAPPARSQSNLDDVEIWVRFAHAPDPATLLPTTVFLKLDTQREPITLVWDAAAQTLRIRHSRLLALRRTYTVVLSPEIRSSTGERMGSEYRWQFTTNSLRKPHSPSPMDGTDGESPFVTLRWGGLTSPSVGDVEYEVRAGSDSIGALAGPPLASTASAQLMPRVRWPQNGAVWWSVTAHNLTTGERRAAPAWRFFCLPVSTAADTVDFNCPYWTWRDIFARGQCNGDSVVAGDNGIGFYLWQAGAADTTVKLADAWIDLSTFPHYQSRMGPDVTVWGWIGPLVSCSLIRPGGPPYVDHDTGPLATGEALAGGVRLRSDVLTAHLEAARRAGDTLAYFVNHPVRAAFRAPHVPVDPGTRLRVVRYREPKGAPGFSSMSGTRPWRLRAGMAPQRPRPRLQPEHAPSRQR